MLVFVLALAHAEHHFPPQSFPSVGVKRVTISGARGRVSVRGSNGPAFNLRVAQAGASDDFGLTVERRGDTLAIEVFATALKGEWAPLLARDRFPRFDLELSGPAVRLEIGWRDGALDVARWPAAVAASLLDGDLRVAGVGSLDATLGDGRAVVTDVAGAARLRGGHGGARTARVGGDLRIEWTSGRVEVDDLPSRLNGRAFARGPRRVAHVVRGRLARVD